MKEIVSVCVIGIVVLSGCSTKIFPIKGNYPSSPIIYHTAKSPDSVWDNLIDVFAQQGLSIKILDRASGLIISEKTSMPYTREYTNGQPIDPKAFLVLPTIINPGTMKPIKPMDVTCEWNVRIRANNGGADINVNLVNVNVSYLLESVRKYSGRAVSTGVFEKMISDKIR